MGKYVDFIEDKKLFDAIHKLYGTYLKSFATKSLQDMNKNIMDPFKFQFDTVFLNGGDANATLNSEIFRQSDKSISNAIGVFHQQLIGSIEGFCETLDLPCDVKKEDNTIFAEVKNKHNTMNVRSAAGVYEELEGLAKSYPRAICYLVEIIAKKSGNEVWAQTINEKKIEHPRIRKISADQFYQLATGDKEAFRKLCSAIPVAIKDYLQDNNIKGDLASGGTSEAYQSLSNKAQKDGMDVLGELFSISLESYNGFR